MIEIKEIKTSEKEPQKKEGAKKKKKNFVWKKFCPN